MFVFLQHMFTFVHLQENLVHIYCQKVISPGIIYFIMGSNSVYIRSIYQLDSNTLLVDLNIPTGELDFNLTTDLIGACNKYFYTYKEETYILEASLANNFLEDPRILQDYSFYFVEGHMPAGSPLFGYQLLLNFYHLAPLESSFFTVCVFGKNHWSFISPNHS